MEVAPKMPSGAVIFSTTTGEALMSTGDGWMVVVPQQGPLIPVAEDVFRAAAKAASRG